MEALEVVLNKEYGSERGARDAAKKYSPDKYIRQISKLGYKYYKLLVLKKKESNPTSRKAPKGWVKAKAVKITRKGGKVIVEVRK